MPTAPGRAWCPARQLLNLTGDHHVQANLRPSRSPRLRPEGLLPEALLSLLRWPRRRKRTSTGHVGGSLSRVVVARPRKLQPRDTGLHGLAGERAQVRRLRFHPRRLRRAPCERQPPPARNVTTPCNFSTEPGTRPARLLRPQGVFNASGAELRPGRGLDRDRPPLGHRRGKPRF